MTGIHMTRATLVLLAAMPLLAQDPAPSQLLAPTPPMGWNSWDAWGMTIDEAGVRATADSMAQHLKKFGWQYVVIDEGWFIPKADLGPHPNSARFTMDAGRYVPTPDRYPSAANGAGFKPLADYIHSLGLKFGIHLVRGINRAAVTQNVAIADSDFHAADAASKADTCPWNTDNYGVKDTPAGQAFYDSAVKLYAGWGVDFLKVDCISDHPYKGDEIRMISLAIHKAGRPIALSLSPGPTAIEHAPEVQRYAQMWRISDDFWDHWGPWPKHEWSQGLQAQFAAASKWARYTEPGHWPDADMLPLGYLGPHPGEGEPRHSLFSHDEQRTLMTLWSICRSPLILGGNLNELDRWTLSLITNTEVIEVNQHSRENHAAVSTDDTVMWTARASSGNARYVAVFNVSDRIQTVEYHWNEAGFSKAPRTVRDLWERRNMSAGDSLNVTLAPHAGVLYRISE